MFQNAVPGYCAIQNVGASAARVPTRAIVPSDLVTVFLVEQRVDDHDQHAEDREHQLRQDAHVVGAWRRQGSLHLRQQTRQ